MQLRTSKYEIDLDVNTFTVIRQFVTLHIQPIFAASL